MRGGEGGGWFQTNILMISASEAQLVEHLLHKKSVTGSVSGMVS